MEEQLKYCGSERTSRVQSPWRQEIFFYNLVIMYWNLNSICMQFEYQYPKSSNVSVEHVQLLRGMFGFFGRACAVIEGDVWILRTEGDA